MCGAGAVHRAEPDLAGLPDTGLVAWVRADMGLSLDGLDRVCSVDDLSGNGFHLAQAVPTSRPTTGTSAGSPPSRSSRPSS
ncbi:MAG: hypothetical protein H6737_07525 [Alphaproteobacteria bacterium]|nr:hypothetical protein [Alphaproteobacteria bacterium]